MKAVIMAGGKGTRLKNITRDEIPKPMVSVCGKSLLFRQIEQYKRYGIKDFVLIIGHLGNVIKSYFGDGSQFGCHITYIQETIPLGTAGSFFMLRNYLEDESFFLSFGDILFDIDLNRMKTFHNKNEALITLFAHPNTHPYDSDVLLLDSNNKVKDILSKKAERAGWFPNCVNAGLYIVNSRVCKFVEKPVKLDLEKDIINGLIASDNSVYAYRSSEYIMDVGTEDRLKKAEHDIICGYCEKRNLNNPQKAIFLDRDGTLNVKNGLIYKDSQLELEEFAIDAIKLINASGYLAIVITNQPVVARGLCKVEDVHYINDKLQTLLGEKGAYLDDILFCPHHPDKGFPRENPLYKIECDCRKPKTGLIDQCVEKYNIDISQSWMIGDSTVDIQTGKNAKLKSILVKTGDAGNDGKYNVTPTYTARNIFEAITIVLGH